MASAERIVITGAAGRIGSIVAERLSADGHVLVLLDREHPESLPPMSTFVECDLRDRDRVFEAIRGATRVLHIGEIPDVGTGPSDAEVFESNTLACRTLLDAAVEAKVDRFIYTSSCQQYGYWGRKGFDPARPPERWPIDELQPAAPSNAYSLSKATNELACRETTARTEMETFIFRFPWVVPRGFETRLRENWPKVDLSVQEGFWTYVHIDDAAEAYALAVRRDRPLERLPSRCEAFHFVAQDVRGAMTTRQKLARYLPHWPALPEGWPERAPPVSCAKAARYLGWRPTIRLVDLLAAT